MSDRTSSPRGLQVDLYHLDAAYIAWRSGLNAAATFDLYTRSAPFGGSYLLVAGLEPALEFVTNLRFGDDELAYLASIRDYDPAFLGVLRRLRFTGDIFAMPEGEIAFPDEPLLRVEGPFIEALMLESGLLHSVGVSTLLATKTARIVLAAEGRLVAEFGYRRAQAPMLSARSAYIGGSTSSSFLAAARAYGLPASGTIPHALIEAFPTEADAFRAVAAGLDRYSLLLDTYDVNRAIETAVEVALEAKQLHGHELGAVRLDSGDLAAESRHVRAVLDAAGLTEVKVLVSGDLDEWKIAELVAAGAPIDGFGVGTSLAVGAGSVERGVEGGALGAVYKLAWYEGDGSPARIKIAGEKSTWPGQKQVIRAGRFARDVIQLEREAIPAGSRLLLHPVVGGGRLLPGALPPLADIRARAIRGLTALPAPFRALDAGESYPVAWSPALQDLRNRTLAEHAVKSKDRGTVSS